MKINNPRSLVGHARTVDDSAYNLATIGQLKSAVTALEKDIKRILTGGHDQGGYGYAWLDGQGKVDVSLIPAIALTETHVVEQDKLKTYGPKAQVDVSSLENVKDEDGKLNIAKIETSVHRLLGAYLTDLQTNHNFTFQVGDIIIVKPTVRSGEHDIEYQDQKNINPVFSGSYIIIGVPSDVTPDSAGLSRSEWQFAKLSDTDGTIVDINGVTSNNSAGHLRLFLYDILKTRYIERLAEPNITSGGIEDAEKYSHELEDCIYQIGKVSTHGSTHFAFKDILDNGADYVPYAKLEELDEAKAKELVDVKNLSGAIDSLRTDYETDVDYISGVVGNRGDLPLSGDDTPSIFALTNKLRKDVDDREDLRERVRAHHDNMLEIINNNSKNLYDKLNKHAVSIYIEDFTWNIANAKLHIFSPDSGNNDPLYLTKDNVLGSITWTYSHVPTNSDIGHGKGGSEFIIGVYDEKGNQVFADITRGSGLYGGIYDNEVKPQYAKTTISVETEFLGYNEDSIIPNNNKPVDENATLVEGSSLAGKTWYIMVAKIINDIDFDNNFKPSHEHILNKHKNIHKDI